jgi:hypothetical protein
MTARGPTLVPFTLMRLLQKQSPACGPAWRLQRCTSIPEEGDSWNRDVEGSGPDRFFFVDTGV